MSARHRLNAATGAQPSGSLSSLKTAATLSELSFTEKNETMLELPHSVKFLVKNINYKSQQILVHDYCLPRQLGMLDLAATPFQFSEELWNYTFFNCSSVNGQDLGWHVPCLDAPGYRVWRFPRKKWKSSWNYYRAATRCTLHHFLLTKSMRWK